MTRVSVEDARNAVETVGERTGITTERSEWRRAQLRRALEMMSTADSNAEELRAELKALQSSALHTAQAADKAATSMKAEREHWGERLRTAQRFATDLASEANSQTVQHTKILAQLDTHSDSCGQEKH